MIQLVQIRGKVIMKGQNFIRFQLWIAITATQMKPTCSVGDNAQLNSRKIQKQISQNICWIFLSHHSEDFNINTQASTVFFSQEIYNNLLRSSSTMENFTKNYRHVELV